MGSSLSEIDAVDWLMLMREDSTVGFVVDPGDSQISYISYKQIPDVVYISIPVHTSTFIHTRYYSRCTTHHVALKPLCLLIGTKYVASVTCGGVHEGQGLYLKYRHRKNAGCSFAALYRTVLKIDSCSANAA